MSERKRLLAEKKKVQRQVEIFEKKYKNFDTIWHQHLKRINAALRGKKKVAKVKVEKENNDG